MGSVTWLHLSDLHYCEPRTGWDAEEVLAELLIDLKQMQEDHDLQPNLMFFSGDLVFGNEEKPEAGYRIQSQFSGGASFLDAVRTSFRHPIPIENVFVVPGNHDVNRKLATPALTNWLDGLESDEPVTEMIKEAERGWQDYIRRLGDYQAFLEENGFGHLLADSSRLIFSTIRNVNGISVGVGGFNSAWSCCRDSRIEKSKLWIGARWQLKTIRSQIKDANVRVALMHHPPNWFVEREDKDFLHKIQTAFDFFLHGHEHKTWPEMHASGHTTIGADACYLRSTERNGYNFVRLDFDSISAEVWLRRYSDDAPGGWVPRVLPAKGTDNDGRMLLTNNEWMRDVVPRTVSTSPAPIPRDETWKSVSIYIALENEYFSPAVGTSLINALSNLLRMPADEIDILEPVQAEDPCIKFSMSIRVIEKLLHTSLFNPTALTKYRIFRVDVEGMKSIELALPEILDRRRNRRKAPGDADAGKQNDVPLVPVARTQHHGAGSVAEQWLPILKWREMPLFGSIHMLDGESLIQLYHADDPNLRRLISELTEYVRAEVMGSMRITGQPGHGKTSFFYYMQESQQVSKGLHMDIVHAASFVGLSRVDKRAISHACLDILTRYFQDCAPRGCSWRKAMSGSKKSVVLKINALSDLLAKRKKGFSKRLVVVIDDVDLIPEEHLVPIVLRFFSHLQSPRIAKWLAIRPTTYVDFEPTQRCNLDTLFPGLTSFPEIRLFDIVCRRLVPIIEKNGINPFSPALCDSVHNIFNGDHRQGLAFLRELLFTPPPKQLRKTEGQPAFCRFFERNAIAKLVERGSLPNVFTPYRDVNSVLPLAKEVLALGGFWREVDRRFISLIAESLTLKCEAFLGTSKNPVRVTARRVLDALKALQLQDLVILTGQTSFDLTPRGRFVQRLLDQPHYVNICRSALPSDLRDELFWNVALIETNYRDTLLNELFDTSA